MRYELYYHEQLIAEVEENDADFPSFFGRYQLSPNVDTPELAQVRAYIDYSVRVWPLIEADRFDEIDPVEEDAFLDLIESEDWTLVETVTQQCIPILVPMFCTNNELVWRLNVGN